MRRERSYRELLADLRIGAGDRNEPGHQGRPRECRPGFGNYLRVVTANFQLTNFCQNLIDERSENSTRPAVLLGRDGPGPAVLGVAVPDWWLTALLGPVLMGWAACAVLRLNREIRAVKAIMPCLMEDPAFLHELRLHGGRIDVAQETFAQKKHDGIYR
jgi:hypothetical protein